ncbi:molybdate ABC transporter substrate-binding protein [Paracoccus beibuensis]|uniref:molybdate ABC transporter substrate-binding protein n=1 Tax=Paracoccus beibuensis TaxID=547602 RepID=UPI0022407CF0|nr:molybdate ABC transporter substrate-binding protein [Paracoccus beibuensis]
MKLAALCTAATLTLAGPVLAEEVTVFAAASMKTALDRIAADFESRTGHDVTLVFAGSNLLARQISEGAPADVFLSASPQWMDVVEAEGLVVPGTRADLLGNDLVLVSGNPDRQTVEVGPGLDLRQLLGDGRLAMALVDSVPAGQYGKAALTSLGLWDSVADRVAQADNVRAALALVATDEAPLGIVYATDAAADPGVTVVGRFPSASHPPITYPVALLTGAADPADRAFLDALSDPAAQQVFRDQGFALAR